MLCIFLVDLLNAGIMNTGKCTAAIFLIHLILRLVIRICRVNQTQLVNILFYLQGVA